MKYFKHNLNVSQPLQVRPDKITYMGI